MDVVVTGSSGLIGTALRGALERAGHRMVPMVRSKGAGEAIHWDPDRGEIDSGALEGVGAVVHLAGEGIGNRRWNEAHKAKVKDSRTPGTSLLAETLAKLDKAPKVLVSGSAVGYYGDRGDEVLTESSRPGSDFLAEVCTAWEAAAAPAKEAGIRVAHIRTGIVLAGQRGSAPQDAHAVQVRGRRQARVGAAVDELDRARGRGRGDRPSARRPGSRRGVQPHGAQPGHQRRHDEGAGGGAPPADAHPGAEVRPQGRAGRGDGRGAAPGQPAGAADPAARLGLHVCPPRTRRCAPGRSRG